MNTSRAYKLRLRRGMRMRRKQMGIVGLQADRKLDRHFFGRLSHLADVRRFVAAWLVLLVLLISFTAARTFSLTSYYQQLEPTEGGTYTEGVLGAFTTASPLYAVGATDKTVSSLLFNGLFHYDETNNLVGDLAAGIEADARGQVYTVRLRDNVQWHDGQEFTAKDVLFTYMVIQNPDAQSPLGASFRGVTLTSPDDRTVVFSLANPLASFKYSLTNGIVPEHLLRDVPMASMRTADFNTIAPVGTGPFKWQSVTVNGTGDNRREQVSLDSYDDYHRGAPRLDNFVVKTFRSRDAMLDSFRSRELSSMVGLQVSDQDELVKSSEQYNFPLTASTMTFFKTSTGVLADKNVRQALVQSVELKSVLESLGYPVQASTAPLLRSQLGFSAELSQLPYDTIMATKLLDDAGWKAPSEGAIREKDGQRLTFGLYAEDNNDSVAITSSLQRAWRSVGIAANVVIQDNSEFQTTLSTHTYDAVLYGISIGVDPDVYAFWHSSQADPRLATRLNFSEYASSAADQALESARTRTDPLLRSAKYKPFLEAWRSDAPALALYEPQFLYVTRDPVYGLEAHQITTAADRFTNVEDWMIRRVKATVD